MHNIFDAFLGLLKVKHTKSFTGQFFNEHPHKYNLFGISKMLSDYSVNNAAIQIPDKENDIAEIETPFIAQFGGDFVAVSKVLAVNLAGLYVSWLFPLTPPCELSYSSIAENC